MANKQGSVRIGPVSILVLIVVICLSVMAMLALTTAQAEESITNQQISSTKALYANESEGQEFLAQLDGALAKARGNGSGVQAALDSLELPDGATYKNNVLSLAFVQDNGRRLDIELYISSTASYEIRAWKATTEWSEDDPSQFFWTAPE